MHSVIALRSPLAKYMRVGVDEGQFFQIVTGYEEYEFKKGSVLQLINPDINQEIYGVPEYLAALQSAFLNESATLFRLTQHRTKMILKQSKRKSDKQKALATLRIYLFIFQTERKTGCKLFHCLMLSLKMTS